jgi:hypothetical protein
MKKLSTIFVAGTVAWTLSTPVLAGSVGIARSYATGQPDAQTIASLERASGAAQREAREETRTTWPLRARATKSIKSCNA